MEDYTLKIETKNPLLVIKSYMGDHLIPGSIPDTVKTLIFDHNFNSELSAGIIPMGTHTVIFGGNFNKYIEKNIFPTSVETIVFGTNYKQPLEKAIPDNLKNLYIDNKDYPHSIDDLSITSLEIFSIEVYQNTTHIPSNVTEISAINSSGPFKFTIPDNIKRVYLSNKSLLLLEKNPSLLDIKCECIFVNDTPIIPNIKSFKLCEISEMDIMNDISIKNQILLYRHFKLYFFRIQQLNRSHEKTKDSSIVNLKQIQTFDHQSAQKNLELVQKVQELVTRVNQLSVQNNKMENIIKMIIDLLD